MQECRVSDVAAFQCDHCGGHLLEPARLHRFLEDHVGAGAFDKLLQKSRDAAASPRQLSCSGCRSASFHEIRSGLVVIDVCAGCGGVYLDKGEASLYLRQERVRPTPRKVIEGTVDTLDVVDVIVKLLDTIC